LVDPSCPSPNPRDAQHRAARALVEQGKHRDAVAAYESLLAGAPDLAAAWFELAGLLDQHFRRPDLAVAQLLKGLERAPREAGRFCNSLGVFKLRERDVDAAIAFFTRAIEADPRLPDAHANLGLIHYDRDAMEPALAHYAKAVELAPRSAALLRNQALVLSRAGRGDEAIEVGRRAVALDPNDATAWHHLGLAHRKRGRLDEALKALRRSVALPGHTAVFHSDLLMISLYDASTSTARLVEAHKAWARCHAPRPSFAFAPRAPGRRLKLGYVSGDFCMHPVGHFLAPVVAAHDRERFEVHAYSSTRNEDALTREIEAHCDRFTRVSAWDDAQLAQRVHQDEIDVLFDLSGHTAHHRLIAFALKPAPIQVAWLGYPFTTGLDAIDYFVSDRFETSEGHDAWFTEKLLRMPNGYLCVRPPPYELPVGPLPAAHFAGADSTRAPSRDVSREPLPATQHAAFTFGCFNNLSKMTPEVVELWSEILASTAPSRLFLHTRELDDTAAQADVRAQFARHGIEGDRLLLMGGAPHEQLLSRYAMVDLALDPFPYSGGLTTCEALWMGVPVVTLPSERFCGRHSLSHLSNVGLPEFAASSKEAYREIARRWRNDLAGLADLRAGLRARMQASPLVDGVRFTRDLERELTRIAAEKGI